MINRNTNAPITPLALAKMARHLLDSQNVGASDGSPVANNVDRDQQWFRAGFMTGITTMCMTAMEALPVERGTAPAPTPVHGNDQLVLSEIPWSVVRIGERKVGTLIDIESGVIYDLMLMPGELDDVTWDQATAQLTAAGGALPSHYEMLTLSKFLGSGAFETDAYWTNVKIKFGDDACESVSYFHDGSSDFTNLNDQMSARGVRRVPVGDAGDIAGAPARTMVVGQPEIESNSKGASVVDSDEGAAGIALPATCAEVVLRKLDGYMAASGYDADHPWRLEIAGSIAPVTTQAPGPDLSSRPDLQQLRNELYAPVRPVTLEAVAALLDELKAIIEADDDDGMAAKVCNSVVEVINGLMLIVDMEKLRR